MRSLVLYFFLLVLEVLFNLTPDTIYKCSRFSKTLLEKSLKFVLCEKGGLRLFNPSFILLLAKINYFFIK